MTCIRCHHQKLKRFGTYGRNRVQRYRCLDCGATFSETRLSRFADHYLSLEKTAQIVKLMVEGMSVRAISRITGVDPNTILSILLTVGRKCQRIFDARVRGLKCNRVQCDEIWNFCYAKDKNVPSDKRGQFGFGDVWTWVGIDADTKLNVAFLVARRDTASACAFMQDLAERIDSRIQLTTDGLRAYLIAVNGAFGLDVDFATLHKLYGLPPGEERRYSPPICIGTKRAVMVGRPDPEYISTSYIERQNLTMRMQMRRFTRLTNAFSKSIVHLTAAVHLYMTWYNFCRVHQTLRVTPAMEAKIADHVWSIEELLSFGAEEARAA